MVYLVVNIMMIDKLKGLSSREKELLDTAMMGQVDGSHHKVWVIDQMVRLITGEQYEKFVELYENNGEYKWETGIAP